MVYPYFDNNKPYVPIGDNATPEQGWQPTLSPQVVQQYIDLYKKSPSFLTPQKVDEIQKHAVQYNIPFYTGDFSIMGALSEFGKGVVSGFTTLDPFDHPDNEYEAIVRNVGHLVGFAPGIAAGPLKMLRVPALAKAAQGLSQYSVPMIGANFLTRKAKSIIKPALAGATEGRYEAFNTATKFLTKRKGAHIVEGAFHLGAASAISSWQQGVDGMLQSAFGGAIAGGGFRAIGNFINTGSKGSDVAVRTLAGSLFQGLPSTMRGATTPEQIYDYLLGAYFGGKEMPWYKAKAFKGMSKMEKQAQNDPHMKFTMDPELLKEWKSYEPEVQKELIKLAKKTYGSPEERHAAINLMAQKLGMIDTETGLPTPEGFKAINTLVEGQEVVRLDSPNPVVHHGISGAAQGADTHFSRIGLEYEVPFAHYTFKGHKASKTAAGLKRPLNPKELDEGGEKVKKADESLQRLQGKRTNPHVLKLLQRSWFQVKTANGVYAIGELQKGGTELKGGTGWTVQMAVDAKKKHIYAFDIKNKNWHRYDYKLNRFRMIKETPKLVKRFAGIGSRKIKKNSVGYKAIQDLYKVTFGKGKAKVSKSKEAVSEKEINIPDPAQLKEYHKLNQELTELEKELDVFQTDAKDTSLPKSQRIIADREAKLTIQKITPIAEKIKDLENNLDFTKKEEGVEPNPTEDGNDIGMIAKAIEKKSVHFVNNYLKDLWDVKGNSSSMKLIAKAQYSSLLQKIMKESDYVGKNEIVNEEAIAKEFEKYLLDNMGLKTEISNEGKRSLRQWLTMKNFGNEVRYLRVDDKGVNIAKEGDIYTRAGNKEYVVEPTKAIEEVYEANQLVLGKKLSEDPSIVVFKTVTHTDATGGYTDMELSRYRDFLKRENNGDTAPYYNKMTEIFNKMWDKGYYPLGGKSDADAIYFVKTHPLVGAKEGGVALKEISKAIGKKDLKTAEKSMGLFEDLYGMNKSKTAKMMLSNMLYDIDLNGMSPLLNMDNTKGAWGTAISKLLGKTKDFQTIKNATAWNKRQQIWFTPGYKASPEYIQEYLKKSGITDLIIDPNDSRLKFRYIISKDVEKDFKITIKSKNSEDETSVDGMTIVRDDVIDALQRDAGMESNTGQNKNFIVSPDYKNGALLGKHMMHSAGPEMSAAMKKKGLHMIIQESAAKQRGGRQLNNYGRNSDGTMFYKNNKDVYDLPIDDIKYNYSVIQGKEMLNPKRIPKQVLTHMAQNTFKPFTKDMMKDFFDDTVMRRYEGEPEANRRLDNYLRAPNDVDAEYVVKNIDKIGISRLLQAIKHGTPEFSDAAYAKIMKFNRDIVRDLVSSGEITESDVANMEKELVDFETPAQRMIKEGSIWSKQEKAKGRSGEINPIFLHKNVRNFRLQVMRNFVMDAISKPTVKNSAAARMRGYDEWFKTDKRFKDLETNDKLFYLDNGFKNLRIKTYLKGYEDTTLGKLWAEFNNKKNKTMYQNPEVKEILRAATVRVPMDAASGLQVLEFSGFTGRKGHGILMHSRAMKAEGGADLDGDESFVFFGGRKGNKGEGWKKEWKYSFEGNKVEFFENDGTIYKNKTLETRKELTLQDSEKETGIDPKVRDSAIWKYNPGWRVMISERARDGRNQLGSAVTMTQIMKAYHNELKSAKSDLIVFSEEGERVVLNVTPKKATEKARKLSSSMIAFASDPMDEAGLKNIDVWFSKLHKAYFNLTVDGKKATDVQRDTYIDRLRYGGLYNKFRKVNQGLYSRNYNDNRAFNMQEISTLSKNSLDLSENSMLSKIGKLAHSIELNDAILKRINPDGLEGMYKEHLKFIKENPELADLLERSTIAVEKGPIIEKIIDNNLMHDFMLIKAAKDPVKFWSIVDNTIFKKDVKNDKIRLDKDMWPTRARILRKFVQMGEDFMTNDVTDMVSFGLINKYSQGMTKSDVAAINRFAQRIKRDSWLAAKERSSFIRSLGAMKNEPITDKFVRELNEAWLKMYGPEQLGEGMKRSMLSPSEELSSLKDLVEVNAEIKDYKKTLNSQGKKLLDMMILGSANRGKLKTIERLEEKWGKKLAKDELHRDLFHHFKMLSAKTSTSMLGFNAEAVEGASVREFLGEFSTVMNKSWKPPKDVSFEKDSKKAKDLENESFLEPEIDINIEGKTLPEVFSGFEGVTGRPDAKVELSKEHREAITELADNLKFYNNKLGKELNEIVRGVLKKDFNAMNLQDFVDLNNYFKELRGGTIWQKLFKEKTPDMRRRYWLQFPETVNREMMKYDIMFLKKKGMFLNNKGNFVEGDIRKPTNILEAAQNIVGRMSEQGQEMSEAYIGELRTQLSFLDGIVDGEALRRIAVREAQLSEADRVMKDEGKSLTQRQIIAADYVNNYKNSVKKHDYERIKDEKYYISEDQVDGSTKRVEITGKSIVDRVKTIYKNHFKKMYETIEGTEEGKKKMKDRYIIGYYDKKTQLDPIVNHGKFIRDVQRDFNLGKGISMDIGLTNLRRIAKSMMIELAPKEMKQFLLSKEIKSVGEIREGYWPHMHFNRKEAMKAVKRTYEHIKNDMEMSEEDKQIALGRLLQKSKSITGDWSLGTEDWQAFDLAAARLKEGQTLRRETVSWPDANQMTGNMQSRSTHIGGYSVDAQAAESYTRNQISTFYKQMSQIMSRQLMHKFNERGKKNGWHKIKDYGDNFSLLDRWNNYLRLYLQDAMGNPSIVPQEMIDSPEMKLKGTPYAWWADNKVKEKVNRIAKKLNIRGKNLMVVKHDLERIDYQDIRNWSNMEAKFELMSLLAHPKSAVANIFGGSLHTVQSTGLKYLKKARDIKEIQKIFPHMKSMQDVDDYVVSKGVLPEFITAELGMSREAQSANAKAFIRDLGRKMTNSGEVDKTTIRTLGRQHKVGEKIMNTAAKFMSVPERMLRRDAYMAHYIQNWERFGGTIKNPDHPFLIEMAKKGVKATQFLYSAPYRPAFARTALGKVMTRFQLWSWNAVKFRNDVIREARIRGFRQGTPEFERFKRTMQIDMFVLALANVFAYSLFDSALPAPYNWLKDTSEWVFGDENERNKAFFGTWPSAVAPLQMVTPPIMRLPVAGLRAFLDNDVEKLANYHVYTMMPFGRMVRDVSPLAKGNLIDNPHRLLEKLTGFPLGDTTRLRKKIKKRELYHPKFAF